MERFTPTDRFSVRDALRIDSPLPQRSAGRGAATIRILDAIKWDEAIEREFFDKGCKELPAVTRDYYLNRPLPFDPEQKYHEFHEIERDIRRQLGEFNAPARS